MDYTVRHGINRYNVIPYVGNKSGFAPIFDRLMPDGPSWGKTWGRIYDVFGGSGSFSAYCCARFGGSKVTYNDVNPVLANFVRRLRDTPEELLRVYGEHRREHSPEHYLEVRRGDLTGPEGAGDFLYLAKNAFSGKIRFNSSGRFNAPMRKAQHCPTLDSARLLRISRDMKGMRVECRDYREYSGVSGAFLYLDPPYIGNPHGHYMSVPDGVAFRDFTLGVAIGNHVMVSEQNTLAELGLEGAFRAYTVELRRSLQYRTRRTSREIIAVNYALTCS